MSSPKPLLTDPQTPSHVRALLEKGASAKVGAADRAALEARLAPLLDAPLPDVPPRASSSWVRWGLIAALAVAALVAVGFGGSALGTWAAPPPATVSEPAPEPAPPPAVETPAPVETPLVAPAVDAPPPRRAARVREEEEASVVVAPPVAPPEAPPAPEPRPSEIALLREARAARTSDPERALSLIRTSEAYYPRGVFAEEREALAIDALSRAGHVEEARRRADAFVMEHPDSAHRAAIDERVP